MAFKGLSVGVSGLNAQSKKMEVIGNNLANLNTAGFKKSVVSFQETYYDVLKNASGGDGANIGGTNAMTVGSGVSISSITNVFTQGAREASSRDLDFMIEGDDFFVVKNGPDASLMLTRNGGFQLDGDMFLVDALGNKVQGFNVDKETGVADTNAGNIHIDTVALSPKATTDVRMEANIDSSKIESLASSSTNVWELFSGGENFGSMKASVSGSQGSRTIYGSGYYEDAFQYRDSSASMNVALDTVTLAAAPAGLIDGFRVGDTVSVLQGTNQVERTIAAVNTGTREITLSAAAPGTFSAGATTITNITNGKQSRGTSGAANVHSDVLKSQISMVDANGNLIANFYRVSGEPKGYTRATANVVGGTTITTGSAEFTNMQELKEAMELALRDNLLTNYAASSDLDISLDNFGRISFGGTGLVQDFRVVMNADNTEMLDRFAGLAITDAAAVATTQARVDANGEVIAGPALGLATRTVHTSKRWFDTVGLENYGYTGNSPSTEYGEFAGLHVDAGANGSGFGMIQLSAVNAMGTTVTQEFKAVTRDPDLNNNEFSTLGELATLLQNTLRSSNFSTIAQDGALIADTSAAVSVAGGRLSVSTTGGVFNNLTVTALNSTPDIVNGINRTDSMNFGTVLGELATGVNGKTGVSNQFIAADVVSQTQVYDSQGNEHTAMTYFVRDRSSGLTNIEWKYKSGLNPNLNTFAAEDSTDNRVYADTQNSVQDTATSTGVLAFDIETGRVLGPNSSASDARYSNEANLKFLAQNDSQEANTSDITINFDMMTSFNGADTVIGTNVDGYALGNLVRLTSESNTGNINGVYSNGKIVTLAKIGLMSINNPEGLQKTGSSYYTQTPNSGAGGGAKGLDQVYAVGGVNNGGVDSVSSKIHGRALEGSNVDLTGELTEMIVTQRSYSASGKIITTTDDMLQEALNLKR